MHISISIQEPGFEFHLLVSLENISQLLGKYKKKPKLAWKMHSSYSLPNYLSCAVNLESNGGLGLVSSDKRNRFTRRRLV